MDKQSGLKSKEMLSRCGRPLIRQVVNGSLGPWKTMPNHLPPAPNRFLRHQETLPHLPVPPLQQTLQKYLKSIQPLVDENQYNATESIVQEFGKKGGLGEKLQEKLEHRAKKLENWLTEWWLLAAYLDFRTPVVVNVSPSVTFPRDEFRGHKGQVEHAAKLISGVLDYKIDIDNETLAVEKLGNHPLCMDQYYKILSSCRIPDVKRDDVENYARSLVPPQHIVVAKNNHFFKLSVYNSDGSPLTIEQLEEQLHTIVAAASKKDIGVGILTSDGRNSWGKAAKILMKDPTNKQSIKTIQRSIFMVCLDEAVPAVTEENWVTDMALRALHGGGSHNNSANRWFDKTLQFIICPDGGVGLTYEHSPAEGPPIMALLDHVHKYCKEPPQQPKMPLLALPRPTKLDFNVSSDIKQSIATASENIDACVRDVQMNCFRFTDFGKNFPKSCKMSPDAFIQVALQLTYMKMYNQTCATYESASLRRFRLGRTDTIRSCTNASKTFSEAMLNDSITATKKVELLREAVTAHRSYTSEAIAGEAIDRHLLGLKLTAIESKENIPEIFMDPTYETAMHFKLSTSQVPCKADLCMGFGPVVPNGYGVCYNPKEEDLLFSVSAYNSSPETDAYKFGDKLSESLRDLKKVLQEAEALSSKL